MNFPGQFFVDDAVANVCTVLSPAAFGGGGPSMPIPNAAKRHHMWASGRCSWLTCTVLLCWAYPSQT
eukprot:276642-Amphidinium_carterae.1